MDEANAEYNSSFEEFSRNSVYRNACCMCVLQIGELAKALKMDFRDSHSEVNWRGWCGIRDIFAHQYGDLKLDTAWKTIENDVPLLRENVVRIMKEMEGVGN